MKKYGVFHNDGREFVINTPNTPRHWYNYLFNDDYITFTSQVGYGEGILQGYLGNRIMLVDSRQVYLQDEESKEFWTANAFPVWREYESYECVHGIGWTNISLKYQGISSDFRLFVPQDRPEELWSVRIKNMSDKCRTIRIMPYAKTEVDGIYRPQGYNTDTAAFFESYNGVVTRSYGKIHSEKFEELHAYLLASEKVSAYDTRKNAFIGVYGSEENPEALRSGVGCTGSECNAEKICLVLENRVTLEPGEEVEIQYALGIAFSDQELETASAGVAKEAVTQRFEKMKARYEQEENGVFIQTPDKDLDCLLNYWTKHQTNMGSRWARVRHNGYRDMVSDSECLASFAPELAWERFKRALTFQYSNGYAPRTWLDGQIRDNNFADCAVWIPMAAATIVEELGDIKLLSQEVAFNDGSKGSVYEHVKRAVDFLWGFRGMHGLIRIWGGDWNDMMNQAGLSGKGVSVWLSIAWCRANQQFARLAEACGEKDDLKLSRIRDKEMKAIINAFGWDGTYYIDAINDQGERLGSQACEEGKIYLIPQLWAILADVVPEERKEIMLNSIEKYLETDMGTLVSWPAYHSYLENIGQMTQKPAGVHENGGVYLHPACWKLAVDSMLKDEEKVARGLKKILPFHTEYHNKMCEPYIMCNSYFNEETGYRCGTAGQTWRSATGAWLTKALLQYVFGLKAEFSGLRLDPCLPSDWKTCKVTKKFRGAIYEISYVRKSSKTQAIEILVDGKEWKGEYLPYQAEKHFAVEVFV